MKNYFYFSHTGDALENLAVDEWFLDHVGADELFFYIYVNDSAVIIGKNQNPFIECDLGKMKEEGVQLVRRISGGGAVYHDRGNLNFSFNAGPGRWDKEKQHRLILEAVRALGIPCEFSGRNDLLAAGRKFSGNAYCSRGENRQHHGTLLVSSDLTRLSRYLTADERKIRSKGVSSVRARVCDLNEFLPGLTAGQMAKILPEAFEKVYGSAEVFSFSPAGKREIEEVYLKKHASDEWRFGQTPRFDYVIDERLSFGGVRVLITLEKGAVAAVKTYTDANDVTLPERVERALKGIKFSPAALSSALEKTEDEDLTELARAIGG